jgi:hypothetical protein
MPWENDPMARIEAPILMVQAIVVAVPTIYVLLIACLILVARKFDGRFKQLYPEKAEAAVSYGPALVTRFNPAPLLCLSIWEGNTPEDQTLRLLRRKAIHTFFGLCLFTLLLSLLALVCARSTGSGKSP